MPVVLVADDSGTVQRMIAMALAAEGVEVRTADDGEAAVAQIERERPDVVLVSTSVPRRSGYDVATFVRSKPEFAHVAVILLAGAFETVDERRLAQGRCAGVIVKPFDPQQVARRVRECLASRSGTSSPARRSEADIPDRASPRDPAVDDYFDQLDAAFARRAAAPPRADLGEGLPHAEAITPDFYPSEQGASTSTSDPGPVLPERARDDGFAGRADGVEPVDAAADRPLPTLDRVLPPATPNAPDSQTRVAANSPVPDDAFIEDVTRRVVQRLGDAAIGRVVADVVADVAERLIREEIARIRSRR